MSRYQAVPRSEDPLDRDSIELFPSDSDPLRASSSSHSLLPNGDPLTSTPAPTPSHFEEITEDQAEVEVERVSLLGRAAAAGAAVATLARRALPATLPVTNDGVFANISAKPQVDDPKDDETPPPYEIAAADTTPPYWQTTVIAPAGMGDMVLVEGMPVGNTFSFAWNMIVSMSFQFLGFLLTYLLHTTHAGKNGSRAGLGFSLVRYGFYMRSREFTSEYDNGETNSGSDTTDGDSTGALGERNDWVAYMLMVVGWFIIIRAMADFYQAKKMEKIIATTPADAAV